MESAWQNLIPDSLLFDIFSYLDVKTLGCAAQVCKTWNRISRDELLWQRLARRIWNIKGGLAPGKTSWYGEVKRLTYHVPLVCGETIQKHTDEVLDVSISHSGRYFCTCSKDALIIMWDLGNTTETSIVKIFDAGIYLKWQLSQYSTFCPDDSLLLVCGVKSYDDIPLDIDSEYKAGVGAVFTVPDLNVVTVVEMDPPTMFGAWLNERVFLGGWPGSRHNTVDIQAYMVSDAQISSPVVVPKRIDFILPEGYRNSQVFTYDRGGQRLFTFQGNRYHLMNLLTATVQECHDCLPVSCDISRSCGISEACDGGSGNYRRKRTPQFDKKFEPPEARKAKVRDSKNRTDFSEIGLEMKSDNSDITGCVKRSCDTSAAESSSCCGVRQSEMQTSDISTNTLPICKMCGTSIFEGNYCKSCSSCVNVDVENGKRGTKGINNSHGHTHCSSVGKLKTACTRCRYRQYVAFVTGNHDLIAIHEVKLEHLRSVLEDEEAVENGNESMDVLDPEVDKIDYTFHLKDCYITGLCLSHDQRFLYFNFREMDKSAPENKVDISDDELPVAEKVFCKDLKIGSIDLVAMEIVKNKEFSGHVGYSSFPAWYICLDACEDYIGSGSEDMRGYIWDRHYGVSIGRLFHSSVDTGENTLYVISMNENSVVNGLAFSPVDQETCITVCDDRLIKVWRSKHRMKSMLEENKSSAYQEKKNKIQTTLLKLKSAFETS